MKIKHLEAELSDITSFSNPKIKYEQYSTNPQMAAHMLYTIHNTYDEIDGKIIGDFGIGGGILGIGSAVLGSCHTIGFDIDSEALTTAQENSEQYEDLSIDFIHCDITKLPIQKNFVDTVIMNPPFGTKTNVGIDMIFLEKAIDLASQSVYSLHKSSTRQHVLKKGIEFGSKPEVLAELRWPLPQTLKFHKKKSVDIKVDFIRFEKE